MTAGARVVAVQRVSGIEPQQTSEIREVVVDTPAESLLERRLDSACETVLTKHARQAGIEVAISIVVSMKDERHGRRPDHSPGDEQFTDPHFFLNSCPELNEGRLHAGNRRGWLGVVAIQAPSWRSRKFDRKCLVIKWLRFRARNHGPPP
ncbi:MAG TPA: hypothetical protein VNA21_10500 [Steroidobacteraceae bacterium]|nr:hypothetical protein [Steroidobacteraceae bacterium]